MATMLVEHFKGVVPDTIEQLETLPGVGHKTASVVICQVQTQSQSLLSHIHCVLGQTVLVPPIRKPSPLEPPHSVSYLLPALERHLGCLHFLWIRTFIA
jgi:hypothetical protein